MAVLKSGHINIIKTEKGCILLKELKHCVILPLQMICHRFIEYILTLKQSFDTNVCND